MAGRIDVQAISGAEQSLALLSNGTVKAWGRDTFGQLRDGTTTDHPTAIAVVGLTDVQVIVAGSGHGLAT